MAKKFRALATIATELLNFPDEMKFLTGIQKLKSSIKDLKSYNLALTVNQLQLGKKEKLLINLKIVPRWIKPQIIAQFILKNRSLGSYHMVY